MQPTVVLTNCRADGEHANFTVEVFSKLKKWV